MSLISGKLCQHRSVEVYEYDEVVSEAVILPDEVVLAPKVDINSALIRFDLEIVGSVVSEHQLYLAHSVSGQFAPSQDLLELFRPSPKLCWQFTLDDSDCPSIFLLRKARFHFLFKVLKLSGVFLHLEHFVASLQSCISLL